MQRLVLVSLAEPTKQKFPHGKSLGFCKWKPSRWKIPNQLHSALTSPARARGWEGGWVLPAAQGGCSELQEPPG